MIKDYRILAALALAGFVFFALSVKKAFDQDYVRHQKAYYEALGEEFPGAEIKQVNVKTPSAMLVDRCQSCHIGASNPDAVGFEAPLAAHPPIVPGAEKDPHDFGKIGIKEAVLNKPGSLTEEEYHAIKRHPLIASR